MDIMKRYKSFLISEKLNRLQLLLEGYLDYSPRFNEKLFDMKNKSDLAKFLSELETETFDDDDLTQNYIDTTDRDDMVSYISQNRYDKIIDEDPDSDIDNYDMKGRTETRIGRLVKGLCKLAGRPVKDQEVEQFVNLYKSKVVSTDESWELVSGDKIRYWYDEENYFTDYGHGPLSRSCMSGEDSQGFFDIYTESDTCQLLILTKNDSGVRKLIGRALVWKPFSMSNLKGVEYLMDRVYCMKDSDEQKFNNYADEMGWLRKKRNNSDRDTNMFFILKGKEVRSRIVVQVKGDWEEYPYLDTLKFLNNDLDELSNIGYHRGHELEDTDGSLETCSECDGSGHSSCDSCDNEGEVECPNCNGSRYEECYRCEGNGKIECRKCNENCKITCPECNGFGLGDNNDDCLGCDGRGKIVCPDCDGEGEEECPDCDGRGRDDCSECDGSGKVTCEECGGSKSLCPRCTGLINKV
jgi:hypothetical protein